ncbi:MAG: ammonia-dependent NAD(+) synthetase [Tropheryma whipplei]|nr:ammonia-dependent NAD(+) synthetase [Tropheryma whipplei]MCO8190103.1 ammonia-dependent NAD(+) synthetase [Tropheryma whipplei]
MSRVRVPLSTLSSGSFVCCDISKTLCVKPFIDPEEEISHRVSFLADYLRHSRASGYVLGISGGQDSALAGRLCQIAVESVRSIGFDATLWAIRLPYGQQFDESDAQTAMQFISPDEELSFDIRSATDNLCVDLNRSLGSKISDFNRGNIKARLRMVVQYAVAAHHDALVVGTDHAAEAVTGFFTKFGDGAADILPLYGLTKGQGRALLKALGACDSIIEKVPTADLLDDLPCLPDETELGLQYRDIDAFLEGKPVSEDITMAITERYKSTLHKRMPPITPHSTWWRK